METSSEAEEPILAYRLRWEAEQSWDHTTFDRERSLVPRLPSFFRWKGSCDDTWSAWFRDIMRFSYSRARSRQLTHVHIVFCPCCKPSHRPSTVKQCSACQVCRSSVGSHVKNRAKHAQYQRITTMITLYLALVRKPFHLWSQLGYTNGLPLSMFSLTHSQVHRCSTTTHNPLSSTPTSVHLIQIPSQVQCHKGILWLPMHLAGCSTHPMSRQPVAAWPCHMHTWAYIAQPYRCLTWCTV